MESSHISPQGLCPHKKHDVMASAIVGATLPLCEPVWEQGSSRRPKESAEEPSLCGHNRSSCKAFGKSVTTKEHSQLSQTPALCPPPHTPMGRWGRRRPWKGKGICLGCKLAKTLAVTLGGVWERRGNTLPLEVMMMTPQGPYYTNHSEGFWERNHKISDDVLG